MDREEACNSRIGSGEEGLKTKEKPVNTTQESAWEKSCWSQFKFGDSKYDN